MSRQKDENPKKYDVNLRITKEARDALEILLCQERIALGGRKITMSELLIALKDKSLESPLPAD